MAAEDLFQAIPVPVLGPEDLGVPALAPAPVVPLPSVNKKAQIAQVLTAFAAAMAGGNAGKGIAMGLSQGLQQQTAQRRADTLRAQSEQQHLNQQYEAQRRQHETYARDRQDKLGSYVGTIRKELNALGSQAEYDAHLPGFANMLRSLGYRGIDENWIRQTSPYIKASAADKAGKTLDSILKNPLTEAAMKQDPAKVMGGAIMFDANGDGTPEKYTLAELAALAGRPMVQDPMTGQPIIPDAAEGKVGTPFAELLMAARKQFTATNRRPPTPKEDQHLVDDAVAASKEKPAGEGPRQRFNVQPITNPDGTTGLIRLNMDTGAVDPVKLPDGAGSGRPTDTQRLSKGYLDRTVGAERNLVPLERALVSLGPQIDVQLPNLLKSEQGQLYRQAKDEFINAALRRESGAAIAESEYARFNNIYFVVPGDKPPTIRQKQAARARVIAGFRTTAGNIRDEMPAGDTTAPQLKEQRLFNGQLGEWDGKGWKKVAR